MLVRDKINQIARQLYARMGYIAEPDLDFESSTHPQEVMCFDLATIAWEEITGDSPDLEAGFSE
jgi:hypothetical protein